MKNLGVYGTIIFGALLTACSDQAVPSKVGAGAQSEASADSSFRLKSELDMSGHPIAKLAEFRVQALTADKVERVKKTLAQFTDADVAEIKKRGEFGAIRFGRFKTPAFNAAEMIQIYEDGQSIRLPALNYTLSYASLKKYLLAIPSQAATDPSVRLAKAFEEKVDSLSAKVTLPDWISRVGVLSLGEADDTKRACIVKALESLAQIDFASFSEKTFEDIYVTGNLDGELRTSIHDDTLWVDCRSTATAIAEVVRSSPDFVPVEEN